jgi:hypothetical protein
MGESQLILVVGGSAVYASTVLSQAMLHVPDERVGGMSPVPVASHCLRADAPMHDTRLTNYARRYELLARIRAQLPTHHLT